MSTEIIKTKLGAALDGDVAALNQGADAGEHTEEFTPQERFWFAAEAGRSREMQALLEGGGVDAAKARPADGAPALHLACARGSEAC
eukprot:CAMPEP_0119261922 /NCGR_PEP_ID=MMETSP1329-20130426/1821_1 /TAXON_ID=114041 /ORGANISM="Genus nov. species nov., Strain RCC1024" /LENGTH=86 /DNA_ID=CAMNT_0007261523 /DNA_START=186 /DNA_END=443 /DNA_ORIENTATION=+